MAKVTKDTMIGELLQIDENVAPMLLNIGMHCLGCPSSQMETIALRCRRLSSFQKDIGIRMLRQLWFMESPRMIR